MQTASNLALRTATEAVPLTDSDPEAHGLVLGPSCWAPSPLECASALEHTHSTVPGLPSVKLSLSLGRPRRRTTPLKRSSACMHRREHTAAMLPKSLTLSDTTMCARPDLLALHRSQATYSVTETDTLPMIKHLLPEPALEGGCRVCIL